MTKDSPLPLAFRPGSLKSLVDDEVTDECPDDNPNTIDSFSATKTEKDPSESPAVATGSFDWCMTVATPWNKDDDDDDDEDVFMDPYQVVGSPRFFIEPPTMKRRFGRSSTTTATTANESNLSAPAATLIGSS